MAINPQNQSPVTRGKGATLSRVTETLGLLSFSSPISSEYSLYVEANRRSEGRISHDVAHPSQPPRTDSKAEKGGEQMWGERQKIPSKAPNIHKLICTDMPFFKTQINFVLLFLLSVHLRIFLYW